MGLAAGVILSVVLATPGRVTAAQEPPDDRRRVTDYLDLVARYRQGAFVDAARGLAGYSPERLEELTERVKGSVLTDAELKAAALLHTEVGVFRTELAELHLDIAQELMARIPAPEDRRLFQRKWYLAIGAYFRGSLDERGSLRYLGAAESLLPQDDEVLLQLGSTHEAFGFLYKDAERLEAAEGYYRRAVAIDPERLELHVRWGRVLAQLGRREEALNELQWARERAPDPYFSYLANLFLALFEEDGAWSEAIRCYKAAVDADPDGPVAGTALSHALHRSGDPAGAREHISALVRRTTGTDSWWLYLFGEADRFGGILSLMRQEIAP
jgi:tetratricopeptide (TPR) repeat protein